MGMKRICALALAVLLVMLAGCGAASSSAPAASTAGTSSSAASAPADDGTTYTLEMCLSNAIETVQGQIALKLEELIEEKTNGRVEVTLYPNATIAATADEPMTVSNGGIDAVYGTGSSFSAAGIGLEQLYTIPFLLSCDPGDARLMRACDKDETIQSIISASVEESTLNVVRLGDIGTSLGVFPFANNLRPVSTPEEAAGLKIRTPGGEYFAMTMRAFGVDPISINVSELAIALQQGVVDGLMTNLTYYHDSMLHTKYLTMPYVTTNTMPVYVNKDWWEALPADLQEIIAGECMNGAVDFAMDTLEAREQAVLEEIQQEPYNVEVSTLDFTDPAIQKFASDLMQEGIDYYVSENGEAGQALVDRVLEIRDELGMPKIG